jgi:hypothetical protein
VYGLRSAAKPQSKTKRAERRRFSVTATRMIGGPTRAGTMRIAAGMRGPARHTNNHHWFRSGEAGTIVAVASAGVIGAGEAIINFVVDLASQAR